MFMIAALLTWATANAAPLHTCVQDPTEIRTNRNEYAALHARFQAAQMPAESDLLGVHLGWALDAAESFCAIRVGVRDVKGAVRVGVFQLTDRSALQPCRGLSETEIQGAIEYYQSRLALSGLADLPLNFAHGSATLQFATGLQFDVCLHFRKDTQGIISQWDKGAATFGFFYDLP